MPKQNPRPRTQKPHKTKLKDKRGALPALELYQSESDPRSHAVRAQLSALGLDFVAHCVGPRALSHEQLVQASGKDRIPYFVDHRSGVRLQGSGAIISYLEREYGRPAERFDALRPVAARLRGHVEAAAWRVRSALESMRDVLGPQGGRGDEASESI